MPKPTISQQSSEEEQSRVLSWLREFNLRKNGEFLASLTRGSERELFLVSRDEAGSVTGGLRASILHHWLRIEVMAVDPDHRGRGVGRALVSHAEELAAHAGCKYAYADTMSFQAPEFYAKLRYRESGRLNDWDSFGHDKIFLVKPLGEPREQS